MGQIHKGITPAYLLIRCVISNFARRIFVLVSTKQDTTASVLDRQAYIFVRRRILDAIFRLPLGGVPVVIRVEYAN